MRLLLTLTLLLGVHIFQGNIILFNKIRSLVFRLHASRLPAGINFDCFLYILFLF